MLRLLGPVQWETAAGLVDLGTVKQRTVLAALAVDAGRLVSWSELVDRVWDHAGANQTRAVLYTYAARIRRLLEMVNAASAAPPARLVRRSGGYLLDMDPDQVDQHRFHRLHAAAADRRRSDRERARLLSEALSLWRGPRAERSRRAQTVSCPVRRHVAAGRGHPHRPRASRRRQSPCQASRPRPRPRTHRRTRPRPPRGLRSAGNAGTTPRAKMRTWAGISSTVLPTNSRQIGPRRLGRRRQPPRIPGPVYRRNSPPGTADLDGFGHRLFRTPHTRRANSSPSTGRPLHSLCGRVTAPLVPVPAHTAASAFGDIMYSSRCVLGDVSRS